MKRRWAAALLALFCMLTPAFANAVPEPATSADAAVLFEAVSGRLLYGDNAHAERFMASTTKIMTALLAIERGNLSDVVTVPDAAYGTEGSSVYLARDERMTLEDLLYGLMLVSGNDAAVTIAVHIAGSVADFAALMNERAAELGCTGTHFTNPHGLPDENHYTTAYDLGRIAAAAMRNETFRTVVGTTYYETASGDRPRTFKNKNKMLWQYEGGCGVKTGFTKAAGRCLVFAAEREGMLLVGVVLHAPAMWEDAAALLDYGFAIAENRLLISAGTEAGGVRIADGEKNYLAIYPKEDILYPMLRDGGDEIAWTVHCKDALTAPVQAGDVAGEATLIVNGAPALTVPLVVREDVKARPDTWFRRILDWFAA